VGALARPLRARGATGALDANASSSLSDPKPSDSSSDSSSDQAAFLVALGAAFALGAGAGFATGFGAAAFFFAGAFFALAPQPSSSEDSSDSSELS